MEKINKTKVGILGYGEIGRAIANFYGDPKIKDLDRDDNLEGVDILHICIPYNNHFHRLVKKVITETKPKLTIIHSTVAPGTTKKIGGMIVHSPIRGIHPYLYEDIKLFLKYIGTDNKRAGKMAREHFEKLGLKTMLLTPSKTTELRKLFSTTYYGLCIAFHGEVKRICDRAGIDFNKVLPEFQRTYNNGYKERGMKNVIRPILYPPPDNGIGGHCIIPNVKILKKHYRSKVFNLVLQYSGGKTVENLWKTLKNFATTRGGKSR